MRLRPEHLWVLVTLELSFILAASTPIVPPDIWWTLKAGELALARGTPLVEQVYTFAPADPAPLNAQWLAQLALFGVYWVGGLELVILMNALLAAGLYAGVLWLCWRLTGNLRLACLATFLSYLLGSSNLGARPQMLAYPLFLACYAVLWLHREGAASRWLLAIPPLVAIWANVHGSFVLGPVLIGIFLGGRILDQVNQRARPIDGAGLRLAAVGAASAAASLLTPYGADSLVYVARLSSNPIIRDFVTEWEPTTVQTWYGVLFFGSVLAVAAVCYGTRALRRITPTEGLLLLAFGYLGLASVRGIVWWGLAVAPIVALQLASIPTLRPPDRSSTRQRATRAATTLSAVAILFASLAIVGALPWLKTVNPLLPTDKRSLVGPETPVATVAFLRTLPEGARIFNYQGWGGYFDWVLWPHQQAFVDGRIEVHPRQVWIDYLYVTFGHAAWQTTLDKYGPTHLALSRTYQPDLIDLARRSSTWIPIHEDDLAVVFARRG